MKDKKIVLGFFLIIWLFSGLLLYSEQIYNLKTPDYRIETTKDNFHKIVIDGYYSYAVPGYPDLPSKIFRVAVPPDIYEKGIEVEYFANKIIALGKFQIRELPPMATWVDGTRIIEEKADIYSKNFYYPKNIVEYLGSSQMRKWKMVNLKYTPFQYNPVTKDLIFIPEVEVKIRYSRMGKEVVSDIELADKVMERRAKKILFNYSEAEEWYRPSGRVSKFVSTYDYVIITTDSITTNSTKLNDFLTYLTSKGYSPLVVTESDYGALTGQSPNGTAEKIRQWLINNYLIYGIEYVLLIGDPDPDDPSLGGDSVGDVPMKMCWPRRNEADDKESPTDYFYADLTGNWDLDGDGYFGEYSDDSGVGGVDFANEVNVGRIPVYSGVSDLDSVLTKTINYGNATSITWRESAMLPMSYSDSSTDGAYLGEAMKSDYLSPASYSSWTLYMQGSLCSAANSSFSSNEELVSGATKSRWISNSYGMVWWWGHGSSTSASLGYSGCGWGTILSTGDISSLNDNYPAFVYQCSCTNGYPEASNNLGTALLYNGAIGTVSASRVSWYAVTSWATWLKYYCDNASIGYYYGEELVKNNKMASVALYDVKSDMGANLNGSWGGSHWMNLFDFNLYGDPAISLSESSLVSGKDDLLGTWDGQGVYYRNSNDGSWNIMATPADLVTAGDLDGDGVDDLIGIWSGQGGVWVKYSSTGTWDKISSTASYIASGDMNGDGRDDLLGTWIGQGVYYKDSIGGTWVEMSTPADLVTAGDLDGDGADDLIGIWSGQGGVWVKYSSTGTWDKLSSTASDIASGDMNGDGRDDLLGTWIGQGVYYKDSIGGTWVEMSIPADLVAAGDINGDGTDDLLGIWDFQGGVYVKYSSSGTWGYLASTARDIDAGIMRGGAGGATAIKEGMALQAPIGGYAERPGNIDNYQDLSSEGPGGWNFIFQEEKNLIPQEKELGITIKTPGPGEAGFKCIKQINLAPQKKTSDKKGKNKKEK